MNVDLELYRVFYTVAKHKHMTKASEELHISQPAISQSIKKLEDQLGGTLFLRSNKGMELTEEGKMFYEYVKGALELINNAENEFTSFKDLSKGEIKIGCSTTLTKLVLMDTLKNFHLEDEKYNSDSFEIFGAIGSHEDKNLEPPTAIAAAVVLGDKTDVNYKRLRFEGQIFQDTHSKVIASCEDSQIEVSKENKEIILKLTIDTDICSIMDYFEIFTSRTIFCCKAANVLGCTFSLYINGDKFL